MEVSNGEKKIYRAQIKAECKAKQERRFRGRRFRPYGLPKDNYQLRIYSSSTTGTLSRVATTGTTRGTGGLGIAFVVEPRGIGAKSAWLSIQISWLILTPRLLYPLFSLEKRGILISCQSRSFVRPSVRLSVCPSVCPSVCAYVRPSVTFLVNVPPPKLLEVATLNFVVE